MRKNFLLVLIIVLFFLPACSNGKENKKISDRMTENDIYKHVLNQSNHVLEAFTEGQRENEKSSSLELFKQKKIFLGKGLTVYNITENSNAVKSDVRFYPVIAEKTEKADSKENEIVGNMIARVQENGSINIEFTDLFQSKLNEYYHLSQPICLFSDRDSLWISGEKFAEKIFSDDCPKEDRGTFLEKKEYPGVIYSKIEKGVCIQFKD